MSLLLGGGGIKIPQQGGLCARGGGGICGTLRYWGDKLAKGVQVQMYDGVK